MGGCFSLSNPAPQDPPNGQPPQPGAAPVAKSLCQSIRDFFMKVNTTWGIHPTLSKAPQAEEDPTRYSRYRRSFSLGDIEECREEELTNVDEVDAASYENNQRASDLFRRWELQLTEVKSRKECVLKRLNEIALNQDQDSDEELSNPLDETETSPEEKLTNIEEVTTATSENKKGASALNQFEFVENEFDPNVVGGTGTFDSAVERKIEDPSNDN